MSTYLGALLVILAGTCTGTFAWPLKVMRKFKFEHWFFVGMTVGLIVLPWTTTLLFCPHAIAAYRSVSWADLIRANLFGLAWGVANVLAGICIVRIGVALSGAFLTGLGVSTGVLLPLVVKGTGLFKDAPDLSSKPGMIVLAGVGIMLIAVVLMTQAGFGRDQALRKAERTTGGFLVGLIMAMIAGLTSSGLTLAFVYGQGPIVNAMELRGASDIPAGVAVWAAALLLAALVNVLYPAYLITKNKSWNVFTENPKEVGLALITGFQFFAAVNLMGGGMILLGALGASIGIGIQQATQIIGNQFLGFATGEWHGVYGRPRLRMYAAIALILIAAGVLTFARFISAGG